MNEEFDQDIIPARMLNELVYCPRLYFLENVAGEWEESSDTVSGKRVHRRVDAHFDSFPLPEDLPPELVSGRSITVSSNELGVIAKVDLLESEGGHVTPIDYKRGAQPDPERVPSGVWPADEVQIAAQVLALRHSGYSCEGGIVYYAASKRRVSVAVGADLAERVREAVAEARRLNVEVVPPPPLLDSPKCPRCSLVGICLPDETNALRAQPAEPQPRHSRPLRRLIPQGADRRPCYVKTHGATIGKSGELIEVRFRDGSKSEFRLSEISHLSVFGNVQLTAGAIHELCSRSIGVSFFGYGGWHYGMLQPVAAVNVHTRLSQFRVAANPLLSLPLACAFVEGKILNGRTLLRRNSNQGPAVALARLKELAVEARGAPSVDVLLGIEGLAARLYFEAFGQMLSPRSGRVDAVAAFSFEHRNRRPPRDPVNALLSLAYALLVKDSRVALATVGFDPTVGFLHKPRPGRPALALDLMEEFRPLIADSVVLTLVNTEAIQERDLVRAAGSVALRDEGRKALMTAYERRMDQEVTHPIFGYRLTYRRVLEVQARLLAKTIAGELPRYPSFQTR